MLNAHRNLVIQLRPSLTSKGAQARVREGKNERPQPFHCVVPGLQKEALVGTQSYLGSSFYGLQ